MKRVWSLLIAMVSMCAVAVSCCGETSDEAAVINNIMTRTSVRSYTSQPVEEAKIETMLRAGMAAPTGSNKQPWEFIVVTDREILDKLPSVAGGMRMAAGAPLAIVVLGDERVSGSWTLDCSAATENILLSAHAIGLGAVWCGSLSNENSDRGEKLAEIFDLPEGIKTLSTIIIGYPDSEPQIKDKWKPEKIHYNGYSK